MSRKVWGYVKGTIATPTDEDKKQEWNISKEMAAGYLWLHLEESQKTGLEAIMDDPKKMWDELEKNHVQKRPATRFLAYTNLLNIQKGPEESLPSLTSRIEKAMQEVKNLRTATFSLDDLDSDLTSMAMIRALPAEYESFVSSLTLLPTFDFKTLKAAFSNEENNRKASRNAASIAAAANLVHSPPPNHSSSSASSSVCKFCGIKNHSQENCNQYKKFQAEARLKAAENQKARRNNQKKFTPSSNSVSSEHARVSQDTKNVEEFADNASTTLTLSRPAFSLSFCWCADTGASSHMTPHREWFDEYQPHSVPVRVANGTVVRSTGIGSVRFTPYLNGLKGREVVFHIVLHVPALQNNLLSVLYLTSKQRF